MLSRSILDGEGQVVYLMIGRLMRFHRHLRGNSHGASATARLFTIAVMVAASAAQLASLSHEMTVRHFRCAEHGELTHVAALAAPAAVLSARPTHDALRTHDQETADAHEHCGVAFTVEGHSFSPAGSQLMGSLPPPQPIVAADATVRTPGRAFVLSNAPKTSPPAA
jgi:hypothetical protein